jgi:hypothetical protein
MKLSSNNIMFIYRRNFISIILIITINSCFYGCKTIEEGGYNCVDGDCIGSFENPQYHTLEDCLNLCGGDLETAGYRCVNDNCIWVERGAQYKTMEECQKNCGNNNNNNNASITFFLYQRCNGTQPGNSYSPATFLNKATINLATSQSNLDDKVFFYTVAANNYGTATINELKPQTYYYRINGVICTSTSIRSVTGKITLKSGDSIEKRIDLY